MADVTKLKQNLNQMGLIDFEVIPLRRPLSYSHYQEWVSQGHHGSMAYMAKNSDVREKPHESFEAMRSVIVFKESYFPHPGHQDPVLKNLKIAHYARNKDYHFWFRQKLEENIQKLQELYPGESFLSFTDSVPLLERDMAAQGALGWIGKNTCLIHPKQGSLFFIGEILTTLNVDHTPDPMHDFCGSCTACLDICPTDAFVEPRILDANKCIAYWNIESREIPPPEIREKMEGWFFGCDLCQTVCPWNIKIHKGQKEFPEPQSQPEDIENDLRFVLENSNKKLLKALHQTPLTRAGGRGLKRNALIVIGNLGLQSLKPQVEAFLEHSELAELAQWTLDQLNSP